MPFDREKELRRERSTLRSLALGIVAFGLWSVLKTIISLMMVPLEEILDSVDHGLKILKAQDSECARK